MRSELHHALVLASRVIFVYVVIMFLLNGIVMLASPQRWFRLPGWLRNPTGHPDRAEHSSGWELFGCVLWVPLSSDRFHGCCTAFCGTPERRLAVQGAA